MGMDSIFKRIGLFGFTNQIYLILLMFTEFLSFQSEPHTSSNGHQYSKAQSASGKLTQGDLEYQICGTFMKHTGQRLSQKQSQLMESSRQFIELYSSLKRKQIDSSRTLDTLLEDASNTSIPIDEERTLNRKNCTFFGSRKNLLLISDQLQEVQERCSESCFNFFNSLVAEYKKMEFKIKQLQAKQASIIKREQLMDKMQEQGCKKRLEHQQQRIDYLNRQILMLKQKNKSISLCIDEKINSMSHSNKYYQINNKVYKDIKCYIQEKEVALKSQYEEITSVEGKVMKAIENSFSVQSCSKCCEILKKLKESIVKLKKYLEGESQQFQRIYDKYKKIMYSVKSKPM